MVPKTTPQGNDTTVSPKLYLALESSCLVVTRVNLHSTCFTDPGSSSSHCRYNSSHMPGDSAVASVTAVERYFLWLESHNTFTCGGFSDFLAICEILRFNCLTTH